LRELIKQIIYDMHDSMIDEESPANMTNNVSGYDTPFGSAIRRKLKKSVIDNKRE
jgi:hypothetical protein